jgi:hypothetical protein
MKYYHMKKLKLLCAILLFLTLIVQDPRKVIIIEDSSDLIWTNIEDRITEKKLLSMGVLPDGYNETNFTLITISPADIIIASDIIVSDLPIQVSCFTNLSSFASNGTLWHVQLPSSYPDATNYIIQRTDVEIYYCFWDNSHTQKLTGYDTYWEFPADETTKDVLKFTISAPLLTFNEDKFNSNATNVEWQMNISRLVNTQRTYFGVICDVGFDIPFPNQEFDVAIYDETGGASFIRDITKDVNLIISIKAGKGTAGGDLLNLRFVLGTILSNVDYRYRFRFYRVKIIPSILDNWMFYLGIPVIAGISMGYAFYPQIWGIINKVKYGTMRRNNQTLLRRGVPLMLVIYGISQLAFYYFYWNDNVKPATALFYPFH